MKKKIKKALRKTILFAVTICTMITGAVIFSILPWVKIKEKIKAKKAAKSENEK